MATFQLELVSPEKLLLSRAVDMAVLPATEGGQVTDRLFVAGGFAEVTPDRCTVLADEATPVAQISRTDAEARIRQAEDAYNAAAGDTPEKRDAAMATLLSARAMLAAAQAA